MTSIATAPVNHPTVPIQHPNSKIHRRILAETTNRMLTGKLNVTVDVTLNPNATSTTLTDSRISPQSAVAPAMALTADGATAIAAGIHISNINNGSCTINHASNAATDQIIRFTIIG